MMRFYEGLAGDGNAASPYLVRPAVAKPRVLGLAPRSSTGCARH